MEKINAFFMMDLFFLQSSNYYLYKNRHKIIMLTCQFDSIHYVVLPAETNVFPEFVGFCICYCIGV